MTEYQLKTRADQTIHRLESQYRKLQQRKETAFANGWVLIARDIEKKMDKVSEKMVRALTRKKDEEAEQ